jgi:hypothetical protein|tara:strand:+ start:68 stop:445 length:378 start_codon:yes stop_codon:yes gene_type:complete
MGQGYAPPANSNLMQASPVLGRNPNTYRNYMEGQHQGRLAQSQNNTPQQMNPQQMPQQMQPQQMHPQQMPQQMMNLQQPIVNQHMANMVQPFASSLNPYLPQNQQQLSGGLASLPGAAQFGKGIA